MKIELLEQWLQAKSEERKAKEKRVAIEDQILEMVKPALIKTCTTFREGGLKMEIKLNRKFKLKDGVAPPVDADIYEMKVSDSKLKNYAGEDWVCEVENKPTVNIVREE